MKEYEDFLKAFKDLQKLISAYYAYNEYGEQARLDDEDIKELKTTYEHVFKLASVYLESVADENVQMEKPNMENADSVQELLQQDMNALLFCKPGMTFPECIKYANKRVVNVTGKVFDKVGDRTNTRYRMTITGPDGKPIKGFFTERQYSGFNIENAPYYIDKFSRMYPECRGLFDYAINNIFAKSDDARYWCEKHKEELNQKFGKIKGYDNALQLIKETVYKLRKISEMTGANTGEKDSHSPFDTRNVAMSNVAHILGLDGNIAKSTLITLKNKDVEMPGCFMEFAKGEDPVHPKSDGALINMNQTSLDHSPVLKTLSDLQVLDYICANGDRHGNNIFYTCDENGKLIDIMGIDNDLSFGFADKDSTTSHYGGLDAIFHISASMYNKIMNLDKHLLIHALDNLGLDQKNIDYTIERFEALKEKINNGGVIVINDEDYQKYTMYDFTPKKMSRKRELSNIKIKP